MKKYYQLRESADSFQSIGVICIEDDNVILALETIKKAIEFHLDEDIEILNVELEDYNGDLELSILRADGAKDIIKGEQTWLYF